MLATEVDRASVEKMVRTFYAMLIKDDLVGPFFVKSLGADLKNDKWYEHYRTLDSFWLMIMGEEKGYMGDPFLPHVFIGKLTEEIFARWLELFNKHIHEHFVPEIAERFYKRSEIIAGRFMYNLEIGDGFEDEDEY